MKLAFKVTASVAIIFIFALVLSASMMSILGVICGSIATVILTLIAIFIAVIIAERIGR